MGSFWVKTSARISGGLAPALALAGFFAFPLFAREEIPLAAWRFASATPGEAPASPAYNDGGWRTVTVPHQWSRGVWVEDSAAWYRTRFSLAKSDSGKRIYVVFDGVSVVASVYVNGTPVGSHRGAYTRFLFDITDHLRADGDNLLAVKVRNDRASCPQCLPATDKLQLYRLYGGIYRQVKLLKVAPQHVDPTDHAASGLYLTPRHVTEGAAELGVRALLRNTAPREVTLTLRATLLDPGGRALQSWEEARTLPPKSRDEVAWTRIVGQPRLWEPGAPNLYRVKVEVFLGEERVDELSESVGFRYYTLTPTSFVLNGKPVPLRGVNKHQESEFDAMALSEAELREDFADLQDLGVNYVRLAHYPHDALAYRLADSLGILVWAENGNSNASPPSALGDTITTEMVKQNFNHPSIVWWSVGNESAGSVAGIQAVDHYAELARKLDPSRPITYANSYGYNGGGVDFVAQNQYPGWYWGNRWEFVNSLRGGYYISETGAGGVLSHHIPEGDTLYKVDSFEPEEYQALVAETHFQLAFRDEAKHIPIFTWWLLRDFGDSKFKNRNSKGLMTYNKGRKNAYYLFKAFARKDVPVTHIASKSWFLRRGEAARAVKVYSNAKTLQLYVNGVPQGVQPNGAYRQSNGRTVENVFFWPAALVPGRNDLRVTDGLGHLDKATFYYVDSLAAAFFDSTAAIQQVASTNPKNPAFFIGRPVLPEYPLYYDFDGTADNSWARIPDEIRNHGWIATRRTSKVGAQAGLGFRVRPGGDSVVLYAATGVNAPSEFLLEAGFQPTALGGFWRNDSLALGEFRLHRRPTAAGDSVFIPPSSTDHVVLAPAFVPAPIVPRIEQQPASQVVPLGASASFAVKVSGNSEFRYRWTQTWRDGKVDTLNSESEVLVLTAVQATSDSSQFACKVLNEEGVAVSQSALLRVSVPASLRLVRFDGAPLHLPFRGVPEKAKSIRFALRDVRGRLMLERRVSADSRSYLWDGRDDAGQKVVSGIYALTVRFLDDNGKEIGTAAGITHQIR